MKAKQAEFEERRAAQKAKSAMMTGFLANNKVGDQAPPYFLPPSCVSPCLPPIPEHPVDPVPCHPATPVPAHAPASCLPANAIMMEDNAIIDTGAGAHVTNKEH